jgi:hypothetical protein
MVGEQIDGRQESLWVLLPQSELNKSLTDDAQKYTLPLCC